ncbi:hypothetical protein GCM10009583_01800 [Ornithinicoccus hortensis]
MAGLQSGAPNTVGDCHRINPVVPARWTTRPAPGRTAPAGHPRFAEECEEVMYDYVIVGAGSAGCPWPPG